MEDNPYAASPDSSQSENEQRPKSKQAKLAWALPVLGVAFWFAMAMTAGNHGRYFHVLGQLGILLVSACLIGGFVYTVLGFIHARKYSNALPHAIGGCATLITLCIVCIAVFVMLAVMIERGWRN